MLISAIMPIMSGFSGHVINLPRDVVSFAHDLPRLPSELDVLVVRKEQGQSHHDFRIRRAVVQEALQWLLENKYYTTYSSFLFCTCLLYMWLHCLCMRKQLPYIIHSVQSTIACSGSPHNALHSLVYIYMCMCRHTPFTTQGTQIIVIRQALVAGI